MGVSGNTSLSRSHKETGFEGTILSGQRQNMNNNKEPAAKPPPPPIVVESIQKQGWPVCSNCTFINTDEKSSTKICSLCEFDNSNR